MTEQPASSADTRVSSVRVAVVQFEPHVGVENLKANAVAVEERLAAAVDNGAGPNRAPRTRHDGLRVREPGTGRGGDLQTPAGNPSIPSSATSPRRVSAPLSSCRCLVPGMAS